MAVAETERADKAEADLEALKATLEAQATEKKAEPKKAK